MADDDFIPDDDFQADDDFIPDGDGQKQKEPSFGEAVKKAYQIANMPASKSREGLKMLTDMIPDPETQSVALNIALGIPKTMTEIGSEFASSTISPESVATMGLGKAIPKGAVTKAVQKGKEFAGKALPKVQEVLTGVKAKTFERVFREPGVIRRKFMGGPKGVREAGEALGEAEKKAFGSMKPTAREINDPMLSQARKTAVNTMEMVEKIDQLPANAQKAIFSNPEMGQQLLKARRATDVMLDSPAAKGSQRFFLEEQKAKLNNLLAEHYPEVRAASAEFARAKTRADVTKFLPVLKSGSPSIARLFMAMLGSKAGVPIVVSSPIANALVTSMARLSLDALERLSGVPQIRELVLAEIARRRSQDAVGPR